MYADIDYKLGLYRTYQEIKKFDFRLVFPVDAYKVALSRLGQQLARNAVTVRMKTTEIKKILNLFTPSRNW